MQQPTTYEASYLEAFDAFQKEPASQDPAYIRSNRQGAMERFSKLGFPTARRGNEAWKYTDVGPIARVPFRLPESHPRNQPKAGWLRPVAFGKPDWPKLVFVDGIYNHDLSGGSDGSSGVTVCNLAEAMVTHADKVEQHLGRITPCDDNGFTALNSAFIHDGAFVHIPRNSAAKDPILLINLSSGEWADTICHPRALVVAEEGAQGKIIEMHRYVKDGRSLTNAVTEMVIGPGAVVHHYRVQQQSIQGYHVATTKAELARDSAFTSVAVDAGARLARNNIGVLMNGEGSSAELDGLYMVGSSQHVDNEVVIDHTSPYTTSRELYKGILDGKSRSVFHGSIIVRKGAQKVDAKQADKNLLLSDQAEADTKPAFWIYADDVKCGHGAANGRLDENALFYLRSRGMDEATARQMLVRAFASEVVDKIDLAPFRSYLDRLVMKVLPQLRPAGA